MCDPSKVKIVGQPLYTDQDGRGNGRMGILDGHRIYARWQFSCESPKDSSTEHKLVFIIHNIQAENVTDVMVEARFRQTYPVVFTSIKSKALRGSPTYSRGTLHYGPDDNTGLVEEL